MGEELYLHYPVSPGQYKYCPKCECWVVIILGKGEYCAECGSILLDEEPEFLTNNGVKDDGTSD